MVLPTLLRVEIDFAAEPFSWIAPQVFIIHKAD
jgi:hypothetical protein